MKENSTPLKTIDEKLFEKKFEKLDLNSLKEIESLYHYDLFDDFLPFMEKYVIDREYGGFMCNTERDGTNLSGTKTAWYEGRGTWIYSYLYNNLDKKPFNLETAKKSAEFILQNKPSGNDFWVATFSKEGKPIDNMGNIYGNLFIAEGIQELSLTPGNEKYWDIAKELVLKCMKVYDSSEYNYRVEYLNDKAPELKAPRVLGHWMVFLSVSTQMLKKRNDPEIAEINSRCIDAIMKSHFNPEFNLNIEAINHDLTMTNDDWAQFSYTGHAIETLWMVMSEALRRKDKNLFNTASERFIRHVEIAWDDIYGGAFRSLDNVDKDIWKVDKVLWLQAEVLIGTLMIYEHTGSKWAEEWFLKMYNYVRKNYPMKKYGYHLWINSSGRKIIFEPHYNRIDHYHNPRHLMINIQCLERIIVRNGKPSGIFG